MTKQQVLDYEARALETLPLALLALTHQDLLYDLKHIWIVLIDVLVSYT